MDGGNSAPNVVERDEAVSGALQCVLDQLSVSVQERQIQKLACERAASKCMGIALDVVNMMYPARQTAATTPLSMLHGSWEPEDEPEPPSIERWVGGFLQMAVRSPLA